jgi:uncharacterized protein
MELEWDEEKRLSNITKHGIDFIDAAKLFQNPYLIIQDRRKNYGEARFIVLGQIENRTMVVVFTARAKKIRIISMRKANNREQEKYNKAIND